RLHLLGGNPVGAEYHRDRVAEVRDIGEDVDLTELVCHTPSLGGGTPTAAGPIPRPLAPLRYGAGMRNRPRVTVLGSLNMDISVTVPRLPEPGATVLGSAARFTPGGKGANQAVAAARLGADVRMAGCVGGDDFGRRLLAALRDEGVGHEGVRVTADA